MICQSISNLINHITPEIIEIRRDLHRHPELSLQEFRTSRVICEFLENLGIEYRQVAGTGVIATIMNDNSYPTIAVRAEMDALPIEDEKKCEYASRNKGISHACGHDANVAIVLGLASVLAQSRDKLRCNIRLLFEPAEETGQGAKALINGGALRSPDVEQIIIFHLANSSPLGMEIQRHVSTAAISSLKIKVMGKSGHWGDKGKGIDAIMVAAEVVSAISRLNKDYQSELPFIVGIGTISGGIKSNIIADSVELEGTLRAFSIEERNGIFQHLKGTVKEIEYRTKATINLTLSEGIPPIYNHPDLVKLGKAVAEPILGKDNVNITDTLYLVGDNAAFYFSRIQGVRLVFLAGKQNEKNYPIHSPRFDFDEEIMPAAIKILYSLVAKINSR